MNLFPSGIAEGIAFCNRTSERSRLVSNISRVAHTVLMAPRRYGKTSLIRQVMLENDFLHAQLDFLSVTSKEDVEQKIIKASKSLLFQLAPELKKLKMHTKDWVKSLSPELNLGAMGQSLTLHLTSDESISMDEMLVQLDNYAQKVGKTAVIILDEFQQISELDNHASIEAMLRHAIERSKAITYIFSGSNRHLLNEMFSQSSRPLYRLCQVMNIDRISKEDYKLFINQAAQEKWNKKLSDNTLKLVLDLTECHPFYINALCSELWLLEALPQEDDAKNTWDWYVLTHKSVIVSDVIPLSLNQKRIIRMLAQEPTKEPYGSELSLRTKLPLSSLKRALEVLIAKDIVYKDSNGEHRLVDPAIRYYLINY